VVLPGSKATRSDLDWLRASGLAEAFVRTDVPVLALCAGAQMVGRTIDDADGVEGPPGSAAGLGLLELATSFATDKVLDRPEAEVVAGPAAGRSVAGYRIHHGRMEGGAPAWLVDESGDAIGWWDDRVRATSLHGLLEDDDVRAELLAWVAERAGRPTRRPSAVSFATARTVRFDATADALEAHLDLDRLLALVAAGAPVGTTR
jgi:adenosylcobyric acid synthase